MKSIFFGMPGVGKGTQAQIIAKQKHVAHVSTGDMLREEIKNGTELGKKAKSAMDRGELVSDEIIIGMIEGLFKTDKVKHGFIFDGFPRTVVQAIELGKVLQKQGEKVGKVFNLLAEEESVVKRISGRMTCAKCGAVYNKFFATPKEEGVCDDCGGNEFKQRADDKEEIVRNRLKVYNEQTASVLDYYQRQGLVKNIDASQPIDEITKQILALS